MACYQQLKDPYRWWFDDLGYVYFEDVDENQEDRVNVALLQCERGSVGPGSALITAKNAVTVLKPKTIISVGICSGLCSPEKTQLGDVVVSAKVATYASKVVTNNQEQSTGMRSYVSKRFLNLIKNCADGWQAPLKNLEDHEVIKFTVVNFLVAQSLSVLSGDVNNLLSFIPRQLPWRWKLKVS